MLIAFDTETTGLSNKHHRIIEMGAMCIVDGKCQPNKIYHCYLNPQCPVDPGAQKVHGLSNEFLSDKPLFSDIHQDFLDFVTGHTLVIHNAPFDVGFLDAELARCGRSSIHTFCEVIDSLVKARELFVGQKNSLDALCQRFSIDRSSRTLHGALIDAELLAKVYLAMNTHQNELTIAKKEISEEIISKGIQYTEAIKVLKANADEVSRHEAFMKDWCGA